MNPVFYFDELDKISGTPQGEEIIGLLTHLTDTSQNTKFHDKFYTGIEFDLSGCLFIFSYNDESKVNRILADRMFKIKTAGYSKDEKMIIAKDYLIPKVLDVYNIDKMGFLPDDIITTIINEYTGDEKGVRNLKRCIENIISDFNVKRIMEGIDIDTFTMTKKHIENVLKADIMDKHEQMVRYSIYT